MRFAALALALATGCGRVDFGGVERAADGAMADSAANDSASPGDFCASLTPAPTLCDDFDSGAFGAQWTTISTGGGGAVSASQLFASSPPTSAQATTPDDAPGIVGATLEYNPPTTLSKLTMQFDLLFPSRPANSQIELADITVTASDGDEFFYDLMLDHSSGSDSYHEEARGSGGGLQLADNDLVPLTAGAWHTISVTLDLAGQHTTMAIDGATVHDAATHFPVTAGTVLFRPQIDYAGAGLPGWTIYSDNIAIYTE